MALYLRLFALIRPYRGRLVLAILATLIFAGATSLYAFLLGPLLKVLLTGQQTSSVLPLLARIPQTKLLLALPLLLVATAIIRSAAQALQGFLMQSTGQRIVSQVRRALYARFLALPQAALAKRHSGDLISRFGVDVQGVEFALTFALASWIKDSLQILALLGACAWLDWRLFLAAVASVPLAAWPLSRFAKGLKRVSDRGQASLGSLSSQVGETIANIRVVQAFNGEAGELGRFDASQGAFLRIMRTSFMLRAAFSPIVEVLGVLGLASAITFAGSAIARGSLNGEILLSFLAALMFMYQPVKSLATTGQQVVQGLSGAARVFEILDEKTSLPEPGAALPVRFERSLAFRRVSFSYGEGPVLEEIDLEVEKGRTLALVGESGSGKSTLAALLLRFWDPASGAIEIDGRDLRSMRLEDLRRLIAYVPQEPILFAGTIRDNVACGREGATEAEILAALEASQAWEFVRELPGQLEGRVGERGIGLSGGQRQRIALARAFLADAPIIVLDEATSALDNASEALVQRGLERLMQSRTALVIAHRLSTVEHADQIAVLSGGRVIERGTHGSLLAKGGAYASLWAAQSAPQPLAAAGGIAPVLSGQG